MNTLRTRAQSVAISGVLCAALAWSQGPALANTPAPATSPATAAAPAAAASPTSAPSSPPVVDQKVLARAQSWYGMLQSGNIDRSQLTKQMDASLTADKLSQIAAQLKQLGALTSFAQVDTSVVSGYTVYHYRVGLASGALVMTFALDPSGKIAGLFLRPGDAAP